MNDTSDSALPASIHARRIGLTAPFVVVVICLSALAAWAATDASFRVAAWKARVALRLEPIRSADPEMTDALGITDAMRRIEWDSLGKRAIAFYVLFGIGMSATSVACYRAIRHATARGVAGCVILVTGWGVLYFTLNAIQDWRAHRQVATLLPKFEQAANALHVQWPTQAGQIPPGIKFYVLPDKYPDVLTIRGRRTSYPFQEGIGLMITRGQNGIIRFDLNPTYDSCVEFHPNETFPTAYTSGLGYPSPPVASVKLLKQNWYLVRYGGT